MSPVTLRHSHSPALDKAPARRHHDTADGERNQNEPDISWKIARLRRNWCPGPDRVVQYADRGRGYSDHRSRQTEKHDAVHDRIKPDEMTTRNFLKIGVKCEPGINGNRRCHKNPRQNRKQVSEEKTQQDIGRCSASSNEKSSNNELRARNMLARIIARKITCRLQLIRRYRCIIESRGLRSTARTSRRNRCLTHGASPPDKFIVDRL